MKLLYLVLVAAVSAASSKTGTDLNALVEQACTAAGMTAEDTAASRTRAMEALAAAGIKTPQTLEALWAEIDWPLDFPGFPTGVRLALSRRFSRVRDTKAPTLQLLQEPQVQGAVFPTRSPYPAAMKLMQQRMPGPKSPMLPLAVS